MKSTKGKFGDTEDRCRIFNIYVIQFPEGENKGNRKREKFPGGQMVMTQCFHSWGTGFNPWSGN